jgi:hypothetical protein
MPDQNEPEEKYPAAPEASGEPSARAAMALMRVTGTRNAPTLAEAARQLGVMVEDLDADYGIVTADLEKGIYAVRVRGDRLPKNAFHPDRGPFSDPTVSTFGTPSKKNHE